MGSPRCGTSATILLHTRSAETACSRVVLPAVVAPKQDRTPYVPLNLPFVRAGRPATLGQVALGQGLAHDDLFPAGPGTTEDSQTLTPSAPRCLAPVPMT